MSQALASAKKRALVAPSSRFGGPIPSASAVNGNTAFTTKSNSAPASQPNNLSSVQARINGAAATAANANGFGGQPYNPNVFSQSIQAAPQLPPPQQTRQVSAPLTGVGANIGGQSMPQMFSVLDSRLATLEMTVKDISDRNGLPQGLENVPSNTGEILEEYGGRFDIIAEEIASLKNTLISLQKYTMEVNKILFEERMMSGETRRVHFEDISGEPVEENQDNVDTPVLDLQAESNQV